MRRTTITTNLLPKIAPSANSQHLTVRSFIRSAISEVVKGTFSHPDDVVFDELWPKLPLRSLPPIVTVGRPVEREDICYVRVQDGARRPPNTLS